MSLKDYFVFIQQNYVMQIFSYKIIIQTYVTYIKVLGFRYTLETFFSDLNRVYRRIQDKTKEVYALL